MSLAWKVVIFVSGLLFGVFVQIAYGQTLGVSTCSMGVVEWKDAVVRVKTHGAEVPESELLIPVVSIGCVRETESAVVVIHSFTAGAVDDYLAIPKGWAVKITHLSRKETDATPKEQANPKGGNASQAPALASQIAGKKVKVGRR